MKILMERYLDLEVLGTSMIPSVIYIPDSNGLHNIKQLS